MATDIMLNGLRLQFHTPSSCRVSHRRKPPSSNKTVHPHSSVTQDHREGYYSSPSVLFKTLCGAEEGRILETSYRPIKTQQVLDSPYFPHGVSLDHCGWMDRVPLGYYSGPGRCLFQCAHVRRLPGLPGLCGGWNCVCLPPSAFWPGSGPMGLPQGDETYQGVLPPPGPAPSLLPGRFLPPPAFSSGSPHRYRVPPGSVCLSGDTDQLREVPSVSFPHCRIPGGAVSPRSWDPVTAHQQDNSDSQTVPLPDGEVSHVPTSTGTSGRDSELCFSVHSLGGTPSPSSGFLDEPPHFSSDQRSSGAFGLPFQVSASGVAGDGSVGGFRAHGPNYTIAEPHDRLLPLRLERGPSPSFDLRDLAEFLRWHVYQLAGTHGSEVVAGKFCPSPTGSECTVDVGQHHIRCLHTTPRDVSVLRLDGPHSTNSGVLSNALHHASPQVLIRRPEHPGRSTLAQWSGGGRVVPGPSDIPVAPTHGGPPSSRSLCDKKQSSASRLCISIPGSSGNWRGRVLTELERLGVHIPLPSGEVPQPGSAPSHQLQGHRGAGSSNVLPFKLVSCSHGTLPSASATSCVPGPLPTFIRGPGVPHKPLRLHASRVETMRRGLLTLHFSEDSITLLLRAHKIGSTKQYQGI